ncbi:MAG: hypothetical protein IT378_18120 [Sandaracinaceae bacterium]|nr:hypothetical protein [Sandaracinaceae bacterium]MCC6876229.1 hypothetical protein [Sandaracinaceae bacterium]
MIGRDEDRKLWEALGELRRTRRDLVSQLAGVVREASDVECSFCGERPPAVLIIPGPKVAICDRCVGLCQEILELAREAGD